MNIIDNNLCFVCGKENKSGLRLSFKTEKGKSISEFLLQKSFQGYENIIHGGIVAAILDEAMIHAAMTEGLKPVTAEITVRFRHPLYTDRDAVVEAELSKNGARIVEARSRITEKASGILLAEATAKLIPLKRYP
jgi:uncharacterized protein (TIGR00369 family)